MRFERLTPGGNLLAANVDMESPQALALGDSFLSTNDTSYSDITTTNPGELIQYIVRVCYAHVKR